MLNLIWDQSATLALSNYANVFLLKTYIVIRKFDIICISETYRTLILVLLLMIKISKFLGTS